MITAVCARALRHAGPLAALACLLANPAQAAPATPSLFHERWIDGASGDEPAVQVQALDGDTFVLRQSVRTNFEAPFLYLLFGRERALLVDTGAPDGHIRPTVDRLIADWAARHGGRAPHLVVAHSHSHDDHTAGDAAFRARPDTTVVGLKPADVAAFFGVRSWPNDIVPFDLGGRRLSIIPTPGHQAAAIMVYDPRLKVLLSGDTLYPGRLYVPVNFLADDRASVDRLASFAATHPIRAALGAHIEMTKTPGKDYGHEAPTHPDEHRLELPASQIRQLRAGLKAPLDAADIRHVHDHFIIVTVPPRAE
ncbi:MBL fold metallo-hydrolase [Novosphingobium olei]|uniref:MBL fold metallo-hydrolase n=1 Tax=Novosphingobium olei TaxID=2728851 RepID=A0A7Y0BMR7_9SPHN|nr:MBL fold metallo-hydrolase [Novosphingobium olei]NML93043.1 MBL fold metallo-hydrolase [Novosphingobium olei]